MPEVTGLVTTLALDGACRAQPLTMRLVQPQQIRVLIPLSILLTPDPLKCKLRSLCPNRELLTLCLVQCVLLLFPLVASLSKALVLGA